MLDEDGGFTARGGVGGLYGGGRGGLLIKVGRMEKRVEKQKFKKGGGILGQGTCSVKSPILQKQKVQNFCRIKISNSNTY